MEGIVFVNDAFSSAIKKYLESKDAPESEEFNSFLVVVIRALIFIYGELDIINPYRTNHIAGFDANLKKYGLSDTLLEEFKAEMLNFYQNISNTSTLRNSFIKIQKILIDMFILKKSHVVISDDEIQDFQKLLYFKDDVQPIKAQFYQMVTPDSNEILYYFNSKLFGQKHNFVLTEYKEIALSQEAYQLAGYNIVEVMNMSDKEIENINNKVYHFFRIKDTDLNKRKRLESAVRYYKKYGNAITSGNGYVDMLLLSSIIATGFMIAILVAIRLVG